MMKLWKASLFSTALFAFGGCSFFAPKTQELTVMTEPADCDMFVNGKMYRAPVRIMIPRSSSFTVTAKKNGYQSKSATLFKSLSKTGIMDAIGLWCFVIPGIGLFSDGAWEVTNSNLYLELERAKEIR